MQCMMIPRSAGEVAARSTSCRRTPSTCSPWPSWDNCQTRRSSRRSSGARRCRGGRSCCCLSALSSSCRRAGPHMAARRPRRGPHAHLDDPGGVLLKMGGYGVIRICYPICPDAGREFGVVCLRFRHAQHGLWRASRVGAKGFQAACGVQFRQPHGLRAVGHRRWSATAAMQYKTDTGRWP